jgi:hypothetical protein
MFPSRFRELMPDSTEIYFGMLPASAFYAAFVTWASLLVRAIRGEDVEPDWRVYASTAAAMATYTITSATRVRETAALRGAAVEMRAVVHQAAEDAKLREQRAAESDRRLTRLTKRLVLLAALTLAAAFVTLVVSILALALAG